MALCCDELLEALQRFRSMRISDTEARRYSFEEAPLLVEAPARGRKRAADAIDPDKIFDRAAMLEEARQVDRLHRQAKHEAKRQQQRSRHHGRHNKQPLKSIPEGVGEEDACYGGGRA